MGHKANECKNKQAKLNFIKADEDSDEIEINVIDKIFSLNQITKFKMIEIEGKIENKKIAKIGIDSGASCSIINTKVAKELDIEIFESDFKIKTANNEIRNVEGKTGKIPIDIAGHICELEFLVINHDDHDALLGLDWFYATNAGIYPAANRIEFNDCTILKQSNKWIKRNKINLEGDNENYFDLNLISINEDDEDYTPDIDWNIKDKKVKNKFDYKFKNETERRYWEQLEEKIKEVNANTLFELSECTVRKHKIVLCEERIINKRCFRMSERERKVFKMEIEAMLEAGIIVKSNSEYSSPAFLIPKKDGSFRMVIDYREINSITRTINFPLPNPTEIFDRLAGSSYFSTLDLKAGYWQVSMDEESKKYTAFSTPDGHYEFTRLPFGLKNAPAEFSFIMNQIFGDLIFVEVYLDDITVHSKTFSEHCYHISSVVKRLKKAGLRLNPEKCYWLASEIRLLGHIISSNAIKMDPSKIEAIKNRLMPTNTKEVQEYLGICNYYRRFIKNFAKKAKPLYQLLKKNGFQWTDEHTISFNELKKALTSYPILRLPDFKKPFILHTDASCYALGIVLSQKDDYEYVVAYASRILKGAEIHYSITEKECLAVIFGVKQFRTYVYGTKFQIITDHIALNWLMNIKEPTGRLARWAIYLQVYDFEIIHRKGLKHSNADTLSRPVMINQIDIINNDDETRTDLDVMDDEPLLYFLKTNKFIKGASKKQLKRIKRDSIYYKYEDGKIKYRNNKSNNIFVEVPEKEKRRDIIEKAHLLGHFQRFSTYNRLRDEYYWKNMMKDIIRVIKECEVCQRNQKEVAINHPAMAIKVTGIHDIIGIDLVFGLTETKEKYKGVVVIIEYLSKTPYVKPIKSKSAIEISEHLLDYISIYGPPKIMISDQGKEFNNELIKQITTSSGIEHRVTAAYNPRTNGMTERFNQTFIESLRKHSEKDQTDWPKWIPFIMIAYKTRIHSTTGFTPFELMFGRKMNKFEANPNYKSLSEEAEISKRSEELKVLLEKHEEARTIIDEKQEIQKQNQNNQHKISVDKIKPGTTVLITNEGMNSKLDARYKGPFTVDRINENENYVLKDATGEFFESSLPRQKLKVIQKDSNDNIYEVEKILDHRTRYNKKMYLVKWKGYEEPTWEKIDNFNSMDLINKYNKELLKKEEGKIREATNKRVTRSRVNINYFSPTIIFLTLFFFTFTIVAGQITDYDFYQNVSVELKYCSSSINSDPIDIESICTLKKDTTSIIKHETMKQMMHGQRLNIKKGEFDVEFNIYSKIQQTVMGTGYECKKIKKHWIFIESIFGEKYRSMKEEIIHLRPSECWSMVESKLCHENLELNCDNEYCSVDQEIKEEFQWWSQIKIETYSCILFPKYITAEKLEEHLFGTNCEASQMYCNMHDSIIIWKNNIIHHCPFKLLKEKIKFTIDLDDSSDEGIIITSSELKWSFQVLKSIQHCDSDIFETSEGLFLSIDDRFTRKLNTNLDKKIDDSRALIGIQLADIDYKLLAERKIDNDLLKQHCMQMKAQLNLFKLSNEKFNTFTTYGGEELILYTKNGLVYKPDCDTITSLSPIIKSNLCYFDVPIYAIYKDRLVSAFLTTSGLITDVSATIPCVNERRYVNIKNTNYSILIQRNEYRLASSRLRNLNVILNKFEINLAHDKVLLEGINYIEQISNMNKIKEENGSWSIGKDDFNKEHLIVKPVQTLSTAIENFLTNLIIFGSIWLIIISVIVISLSIYNIVRRLKKRTKSKFSKAAFNASRNEAKLELGSIDDQKELLNELSTNGLFKKIQKKDESDQNSIISIVPQ
jgi:hypothetical protein